MRSRPWAQQRLGHTTEAASCLKKAVQAIDEPKTAQDPATIPWNRRLTLQLLRREAEELLKKESGISNQQSGVRSQESGVRNQESQMKPN